MLVPNATRRPKITLVGDLLADVWWLAGPATRNIEHAAMALVSHPRDRKIRPGGMGIVIDALRQADVEIAVYSTAGVGYEAEAVISYLGYHSVPIHNITRDEAFNTPVKTRYVNENGHILLRHDSELVAPTTRRLPDTLEQDIATSDIVVVSDYGKGCIHPADKSRIVATAQQHNTFIAVDTKPAMMPAYFGVNAFKLNRLETEQFAGVSGNLQSVMEAAAAKLAPDCVLVTTDGGAGAGYAHNGYDFIPAPRKYSSGNCVGAGDIFFVGFILGLLQPASVLPAPTREDIARAVRIGLIAAGQRVRTNGFKPFCPHKVFAEIARIDNQFNPARKILTYNEFCRRAANYRKAGKNVVFTNGCFDLLHEGHVRTLSWARQQGSALFVAVDSDANVRRLKGPLRPVHDQQTRATNIAALECVDGVYVFDEQFPDTNDSLRSIIREVQPAVLAKGADYINKEVVGSDIADRVALCPLVPDKSTTVFVNKIKAGV